MKSNGILNSKNYFEKNKVGGIKFPYLKLITKQL